MRSAREHSALGVDQAFNTVSGTVKAARQLGHLVVPFDLQACAEASSTECLNPRLQALKTPRDTPDDGICP